MGTGYYDYEQPLQAPIPGLENFRGAVIHPQFWPEHFDCTDRNMVALWSGATTATLVLSVADKVKQVTILQRSLTYIASVPTRDRVKGLLFRFLHATWPVESTAFVPP